MFRSSFLFVTITGLITAAACSRSSLPGLGGSKTTTQTTPTGSGGFGGETTGSGATAGSGGMQSPPVAGYGECLNVWRSDFEDFETAVMPNGWFLVEPDGDIQIYVGSPSGVATTLGVNLTIAADWPLQEESFAEVWRVEETSPPIETVSTGQVRVGVDLLLPGDRLRGWFDGTVGTPDNERHVALSFELLHPEASCRHRRCLQGEALWKGSACCCGGVLQPAQSPLAVEGSCSDYKEDSSPGSLRACTTAPCPTGFGCAPEPGDPRLSFCRPACSSNADCKLFEVCSEAVCRPLRCHTDADCGPDRDCISPHGIGTKYCAGVDMGAEDQCLPEMYSGDDAHCIQDCGSDSACPAGWICERRRGDKTLMGYCAPDCSGRACNRIATDFEDTMKKAKACGQVAECKQASGCGLWVKHWEHCSSLLFIVSGQEELDAVNDEWMVACGDYPPMVDCPVCDGIPTCSLTCTDGACTGNCQ